MWSSWNDVSKMGQMWNVWNAKTLHQQSPKEFFENILQLDLHQQDKGDTGSHHHDLQQCPKRPFCSFQCIWNIHSKYVGMYVWWSPKIILVMNQWPYMWYHSDDLSGQVLFFLSTCLPFNIIQHPSIPFFASASEPAIQTVSSSNGGSVFPAAPVVSPGGGSSWPKGAVPPAVTPQASFTGAFPG